MAAWRDHRGTDSTKNAPAPDQHALRRAVLYSTIECRARTLLPRGAAHSAGRLSALSAGRVPGGGGGAVNHLFGWGRRPPLTGRRPARRRCRAARRRRCLYFSTGGWRRVGPPRAIVICRRGSARHFFFSLSATAPRADNATSLPVSDDVSPGVARSLSLAVGRRRWCHHPLPRQRRRAEDDLVLLLVVVRHRWLAPLSLGGGNLVLRVALSFSLAAVALPPPTPPWPRRR